MDFSCKENHATIYRPRKSNLQVISHKQLIFLGKGNRIGMVSGGGVEDKCKRVQVGEDGGRDYWKRQLQLGACLG